MGRRWRRRTTSTPDLVPECGRSVRIAQERARATVTAHLAGSAGVTGVTGVRLQSVKVVQGEGGPEVTVRLAAPARVGLPGCCG